MADHVARQDAHSLHGPHTVIHRTTPAGFVPLRLRIQPANVQVEVHQSEAVIGRHSQADVRIPDAEISRRHARLAYRDGRWRIIDMNSLNGVYVNDQRVVEAELCDGDRIRIAGCTILVERCEPVHVLIADGVLARAKKTDPAVQVLKSIADVLPKAS
jgi:pSer/pThr/pTyr-binding forkhead associated (FHA) protein